MFEKNDEKYLIRAISQNRVVLFLGAGFPVDVENRLGSKIPIGHQLGQLFWEFLGYEGKYDSTPLADMYEAVIGYGKKESEITAFIEANLMCDSVPDEYKSISSVCWYRVYTTNIDNVIEEVYKGGEQILDIISYPNDELGERDQSLGKVQLICLHGKFPCKPGEITFSVRQYARRTNAHDPLYDQFIRDYATHPTIFIGTQLNEPLFWQYIEARSDRPRGISEQRQKSFLISPHISPPKKTQLKKFNVTSIEGTTDEFLSWIKSVTPKLPTRLDILKSTAPDIAQAVGSVGLAEINKRARIAFAKSFHRVPTEIRNFKKRSPYLLGATPQWEDILFDLDASREITVKIEKSINKALSMCNSVKVYVLLGSAGCGKSTVLRRLGLNLARSGHIVYLTNSEELPKPQNIVRSLDSFSDRSVLLFDNAEISLAILPSLVNAIETANKPPVIVVASRTNEYDRRVARFSGGLDIDEFHVPVLIRGEIEQLISILNDNNLLGCLQGMNHQQRLKEFEIRSSKQILVAMREATLGKGFDEILEDEFKNLTPQEAKVLYLCVALATEAGYRIKKEELVGCSHVKPAETLHLLERNLRDVVVSSGMEKDLLMLRHKKIAEWAIESTQRELLKEAYVRILQMLAGVVGGNWRTRNFSFYREIINHSTIYKRFEEDIEQARFIYDALADRFKRDAQFWLQYGSLELEGGGGSLALSENYLNQAESLDAKNAYIQNAKGHLLLRKGVYATTKTEAISLRDGGSKILLNSMDYLNDPYPYHIYCIQRHKWMQNWVSNREGKAAELSHLRDVLRRGVRSFPRNRRLKQLDENIEREYLLLATLR